MTKNKPGTSSSTRGWCSPASSALNFGPCAYELVGSRAMFVHRVGNRAVLLFKRMVSVKSCELRHVHQFGIRAVLRFKRKVSVKGGMLQ